MSGFATAGHPGIATSARIAGEANLAPGSALAQGVAVRSHDGAVSVGEGSAVLENSVVVGRSAMAVSVGHRTVFGHRCTVVGATVGDLCEIGNGAVLLPGSTLGDRCFLGEGALVPPGTRVPDDAVLVGRPARRIRLANEGDLARLAALRGGSLEVHPRDPEPVHPTATWGADMGHLYELDGRRPTIASTATIFDTAEITGDVVVGERTIIGAGVRVIGDSHGPVRIGDDVQILENTVLHLLPDNELVLEDGVVVAPGAMIHGCRLGAGSVVEPAATVCDWAEIGAGSVVRAGSLVPQRATHGARLVLEGFPAKEVDTLEEDPPLPPWALHPGDLATLRRVEPDGPSAG